MAEGWTRSLLGDVIEAYSAGIEAHGLNPNAVQVMAEAGVDIAHHQSKVLGSLKDINFDHVVRVCGRANDHCLAFSGHPKLMHVSFDDPPALARNARSPQEVLGHYRRVRDEIKALVLTLPDALLRS